MVGAMAVAMIRVTVTVKDKGEDAGQIPIVKLLARDPIPVTPPPDPRPHMCSQPQTVTPWRLSPTHLPLSSTEVPHCHTRRE